MSTSPIPQSPSSPEGTEDEQSETLPGWTVLHLFCKLDANAEGAAIELAFKDCEAAGQQIISAAMLGHKSDLGVVAIGPDVAAMRTLQTNLTRSGAIPTYSYLSLTEISEYAAGVPKAMRTARLRPVLPPEGLPAFCFYPMSKRRDGEDNWYQLSFDERIELMAGHGKIGRTFRGRVLQLVTGSAGLDEYEWGVTLFGRTLEDLKECVYTMRFDEASTRYADFGPFLAGTVDSAAGVLASLGLGSGTS